MKRAVPYCFKTLRLMAQLGCCRSEAVGILEMLWWVTATQTPQGDIGRFSDAELAHAIGTDRDPATVVGALRTAGWLDPDAEHRLLVHDWADHADQTVRRTLGYNRLQFHQASSELVSDGVEPSSPSLALPCQSLKRIAAPRAPARRAARAKVSWPDDLKLTDERRQVAADLGLDPAWEWNKFRDHALAHDSRYANWDMAWRSWCRQAIDFGRGHAAR
jgi:hypothetical protein